MTIAHRIVRAAGAAAVHVGCVLALVAAGVIVANARAFAPLAALGPAPSCLPRSLQREGPLLATARPGFTSRAA